MISLGEAVGLVGSLIAGVSIARSRWHADNRKDEASERQERMDHQDCLEKLDQHIERSRLLHAETCARYDAKLQQLDAENDACKDNNRALAADIRALRTEFRRSITPPDMRAVKGPKP